MADKRTDLELVASFKSGDIGAYEELIGRYSAKAFSLASRLTRSQEDAEEVLQDVFVAVFRKIGGFEGKSTFSSWLYRVTVNAAFMKLRKRKQDQSISIEDLSPQIKNLIMSRSSAQHEGDSTTLRSQVMQALEESINKLPEDYRPVFILRDIDGLTSREVGKILDLSIPAVKSRLHRSRLMLKRRLAKFYREYISGAATGTPQRAGNV